MCVGMMEVKKLRRSKELGAAGKLLLVEAGRGEGGGAQSRGVLPVSPLGRRRARLACLVAPLCAPPAWAPRQLGQPEQVIAGASRPGTPQNTSAGRRWKSRCRATSGWRCIRTPFTAANFGWTRRGTHEKGTSGSPTARKPGPTPSPQAPAGRPPPVSNPPLASVLRGTTCAPPRSAPPSSRPQGLRPTLYRTHFRDRLLEGVEKEVFAGATRGGGAS